jgi:predicted Zn-dependent protease
MLARLAGEASHTNVILDPDTGFLAAISAMNRFDARRAITLLNGLLEQPLPDRLADTVRGHLASAYILRFDGERSDAVLAPLLARGLTSPWLDLRRGQAAVMRRSYREAVPLLERYIADSGDDPDAVAMLAVAQLYQENWAAAIDAAERLLAVSEDNDLAEQIRDAAQAQTLLDEFPFDPAMWADIDEMIDEGIDLNDPDLWEEGDEEDWEDEDWNDEAD